jgi:hypothetical protein
LGELIRSGRGVGEGAVQAQPVPDDDVPGGDRGAEVGDERAKEPSELVLVDGHDGLLSVGVMPGLFGPGRSAASLGRDRLRFRQCSVNVGKAAAWGGDVQ